MKKILFLLFIIININLNAQLELVPDNPILHNITVLSLSEKEEILQLPPLEINYINQNTNRNGTRVVYFLHGLGGNSNSWQRAAIACENADCNVEGFHARKVESFQIDYSVNTNTDMNGALNSIRNFIRNNNVNSLPEYDHDKTNNFIIAHSQGGVVLRSLLKYDTYDSPNLSGQTRGYGGFVTVASPLQGAMILNNQEKILEMAEEGCNKLFRAKTNNVFAKTLFWLLGKDLVGISCEALSFNALPYFFKDEFAPITDDYHVGSLWIDKLNTSCNNQTYIDMPKVAFYGIEPNTNIFWRTLNWFNKSPNDPVYWEANDDFGFFLNTIMPVFLDYNLNLILSQIRKKNVQNYMKWLWGYGFPGIVTYNSLLFECDEKISAWQAGVDWFISANDKWETIIGSKQIVLDYTETLYLCFSESWFPPVLTLPIPNYCPPGYSYTNPQFSGTQYHYKTIHKESDGVVLAESAYDLPHATHDPVKHRGIENTDGTYTGSSHMQIRNDKALKDNLHLLFEGEYGMYFKTDEK